MPASSDIRIASSTGAYDVHIAPGSFPGLLSAQPDDVIIADAYFAGALASRGERLITLEAVEGNKTLGQGAVVISALRDLGVGRGDQIIAVGGGIVQDVSTLAASLYMRGLAWTYVPTTLLGMADSCIGGKSSINTRTVKNLIGNIYPPSRIYIDTNFLSTLSDVDYLCGLSEASKICFCRGESEFKKFLAFAQNKAPSDVAKMVAHVLAAKKWFIEVDEFDKAERKNLNFGHTFGHALEVGSNHAVPHGLAVASGIKAAILFESKNRSASEIEHELFSYVSKLTSGISDLFEIDTIDWAKYSDAFKADKKHSGDEYSLLLPNYGGGVRIEKFEKSDDLVSRVIDAQKSSLSGAKL